MHCPRCQRENRPQAKFCEECGAPLARSCGHCGAALSTSAKFCSECGRATGVPPEPEARFASPHAITRGQGQRGHETYALRLLGEITSRGDPLDAETAEGYYRQALTLATELEMRPLVAHCHLGLGKLYRRSGDHVQARQHLMTASAMYREMDMGFWLEKAETELGGAER